MKNSMSPARRRELRAAAHHLDPVVMIGHDGLTPAVLHEIDVNLLAHGLIKIRVFSDDRGERAALLERIAAELDASPIQHIGKLLVVFRPIPDEKPGRDEPADRRPATGKVRRPPVGSARAKPGRRPPGTTARTRAAPGPEDRRPAGTASRARTAPDAEGRRPAGTTSRTRASTEIESRRPAGSTTAARTRNAPETDPRQRRPAQPRSGGTRRPATAAAPNDRRRRRSSQP